MRHRFGCGVAVMAALIAFAATQRSRAQNTPPATSPAPSSSEPAAPGVTVSPASTAPASSSPSATPVQGAPPPTTSHGQHTVTVTFDYDFGKTPACTAKITTACVQQFIAFDISGGTKNPPMLFPIALPTNPTGVVKGITKTSPLIDFESGKHLISVSAMSPDGKHSKRSLCTTWITIP